MTSSLLNTHLRDNLNAVLPVGTLIMRAANYTTVETAVEGRWLQCNGVAVSRTTYATLFSYLNGLTPALPFGSGDGLTTFNLPDLRGRSPYGEGEKASVDQMGDNEGSLISDRGPEHTHNAKLASFSGGGGDLINASSKDTGQDSAPLAVGVNGGAIDKPAYLVAGSYFIKYTS